MSAPPKQTAQQIEFMAKVAAKFLVAKFSSTTASDSYPVPSQAVVRADITRFVATALTRANLSVWVHYYALLLLEKYAALDYDPRRRDPTVYALFITAYKVACAALEDQEYTGRSWRYIAQDWFTAAQMGEYERDFTTVLDWRFHVSPEDLQLFCQRIVSQYRT